MARYKLFHEFKRVSYEDEFIAEMAGKAKTMVTAAIDFETANYSDASICAAGIAVFDGDELSETLSWLIRPPKGHGYFLPIFTAIHGLNWFDVKDAPEFPAIAPQLLDCLKAVDLVIAHHARFDMRKLVGTLGHFGIPDPPFLCVCTRDLARRAWPELPNYCLDTLAAHIGHDFCHHDARSDAEAAGRILMAMVKHVGAKDPLHLCMLLHPTVAHSGSIVEEVNSQ